MSAVVVTVCGEHRRRDLTIPRAAPIAELLPSIAREVDSSPSDSAALSTVSGEPLDAGLTADDLGLHDGQVLLLREAGADAAVRVFDDPATSLATRASADVPWSPQSVATALVVAGLTVLTWWIVGSPALSVTVLATAVASAAACYPLVPALCLRIGGLSNRLDLPHDTGSLAVEESATRRAAALTRILDRTTRITVGIGGGLLMAVPHPATVTVAAGALATTVLRQRLAPRPIAATVTVLASTYAGILLTAPVLAARPGPSQFWLLTALTLAALALRVLRPRPLPGLARLAGIAETLARSALLPTLLWVWGVPDVVLALVRS